MAPCLFYHDTSYDLLDGETVLDGLLRHGVNIPHSCKSGTCQSCLMQASPSSAVPQDAVIGLKPAFKKRGFFLACQCVPNQDLHIKDIDGDDINIQAVLHDKTYLNHNVMQVTLNPSDGFDLFECRPGQYFTLINTNQVGRSYSIANTPMAEGVIILHIRLIDNGIMSNWLRSDSSLNANITLRGPAGNCFYTDDDGDNYPIILAGTGTGLAPLYGITHNALNLGHKGTITLYHGALNPEDLYLVENLQALAQQYTNFSYTPCCLNGDCNSFYTKGDLKDLVIHNLPEDKENAHIYLCGAPDMVNDLKTRAFLSGLKSKNIHTDPFLPSK